MGQTEQTRHGRRAQRLAFAAASLLLGMSARARADDSTQSAEALFQRARERMGQGDFAAACPMLEQSYSLDHGAGTMLALAICHEGAGKPALALREFRESLSMGVRANRPDRVILAESHVQSLEATVPRIKLRPPTPEPPGLALTLDGAGVDRTEMVAGIPVDPGAHVIEASAPGVPTWRTSVEVGLAAGKSAAPVVVDIPPFEPLGATVGAPVAPDRGPGPSSSTPRTLGWISGGLGVAAAAVGAGFGLAAFGAEARSRDTCQDNVCSPAGVDLNHEARRDALVSDVTFAVAGVALAGAVFLLARGRSARAAASLVPSGRGAAFPFDLPIACTIGYVAGGADVGIAGSW
jgi:hypothetical protein